jgi:hypothetical protein
VNPVQGFTPLFLAVKVFDLADCFRLTEFFQMPLMARSVNPARAQWIVWKKPKPSFFKLHSESLI